MLLPASTTLTIHSSYTSDTKMYCNDMSDRPMGQVAKRAQLLVILVIKVAALATLALLLAARGGSDMSYQKYTNYGLSE